MRRTATLLLSTLLLFASCGGSSDPADLVKEGDRALGAQDFASALTSFEDALAAIGDDTSHDYYMRAKLGSIEARATTDAAKAKDDLIGLSASSTVSDKDFNIIASRMGEAGKFEEAVELLAKGKELYPESTHLDKLGAKLVKDAESAGASEALNALAGLGYVGD